MRTIFLCSFFLLTLLSGTKAWAQSDVAGRLWIRAFATGPEIGGLFYDDGNDYQSLVLKPYRPSLLTSIAHPGPTLPLYTKSIDPKTGEEIFVESAIVEVPKDCHQLTFIVTPDRIENGIRKFNTVVYEDSSYEFPVNSVRLINLSSKEVAAKFGDKTFRTPPGGVSVEPVTVDKKSRVFAVAGQLASTETGVELHKFYQGPVTVPQGRRLTLLIVYDIEGMRAHGYDIMKDSNGQHEVEFIVVKWLDRPLPSAR